MLKNYKESCKGAVKEWVESTTKRKFDNLTFEDYKEFVVDYKVEVINTLGTTAEKSVETSGGWGKAVSSGDFGGGEGIFGEFEG